MWKSSCFFVCVLVLTINRINECDSYNVKHVNKRQAYSSKSQINNFYIYSLLRLFNLNVSFRLNLNETKWLDTLINQVVLIKNESLKATLPSATIDTNAQLMSKAAHQVSNDFNSNKLLRVLSFSAYLLVLFTGLCMIAACFFLLGYLSVVKLNQTSNRSTLLSSIKQLAISSSDSSQINLYPYQTHPDELLTQSDSN